MNDPVNHPAHYTSHPSGVECLTITRHMGFNPPLFYFLAALGHLVAKLMGGQGGYYDGRLALFWALTCITPAMLILGLVRSFLGDGPATTGLGLATFLAFIVLYSTMLREVEGQ